MPLRVSGFFFRNLPDRWRFSYRQAYQHWLVSRTLQTNRSLSYLTQRQRSLPPFCWKEIARPSSSRLCRYRGRRRWEPPSQNNRGSLLQRQGCRGVGRRWTKVDAQSSTSFTENLLQPFLGHFPSRICTKFRKSGGWGAEILIYWVILVSCRQFHGIDCSTNCGKFAAADGESLYSLKLQNYMWVFIPTHEMSLVGTFATIYFFVNYLSVGLHSRQVRLGCTASGRRGKVSAQLIVLLSSFSSPSFILFFYPSFWGVVHWHFPLFLEGLWNSHFYF